MPYTIRLYVRYIDEFNRRVGGITTHLVFVMLEVLLFLSIIRHLPQVFDQPPRGIGVAQFVVAVCFVAGGACMRHRL